MSPSELAGTGGQRRSPFDLGTLPPGIVVHLWLIRYTPDTWGTGRNAFYGLSRMKASVVTDTTVSHIIFQPEDENGRSISRGLTAPPNEPLVFHRYLQFGEILRVGALRARLIDLRY